MNGITVKCFDKFSSTDMFITESHSWYDLIFFSIEKQGRDSIVTSRWIVFIHWYAHYRVSLLIWPNFLHSICLHDAEKLQNNPIETRIHERPCRLTIQSLDPSSQWPSHDQSSRMTGCRRRPSQWRAVDRGGEQKRRSVFSKFYAIIKKDCSSMIRMNIEISRKFYWF